MSSEIVGRAADLYRGGMTVAEVAKAVGFSRTTTERRLISAGIVFRPSHRRPYHEKACRECKVVKRREQFAKGHGAICADCWRVHPAKLESTRNRVIRQYGITREDLNAILERQNFKCAICKTLVNYRSQIDHCHKTGKVRGVLCPLCNRMLGMARDNVDVLATAIGYLLGAS